MSFAGEKAVLSVSDAYDVALNGYIRVLVITLIVYDYFLTFSDEVSCIWMRPKTSTSYLFFVNRYLTLFGHLALLVGVFPLSNQACSGFLLYRQLLLVVLQVTICAMMSIRVYLLWGRSRMMLFILIGLNVSLLGVAIYSLASEGPRTTTMLIGCTLSTTSEGAIHVAIGWMALLAYDIIVLALLVAKTYSRFIESNLVRSNSSPLLTIVFRDGLLYFGAMVLSGIPNLLSYFLFPPILRGSLSTFANSLAAVIMSRIIFNLHQAADDIQRKETMDTVEETFYSQEREQYFTTMEFDEDYDRDTKKRMSLSMV